MNKRQLSPDVDPAAVKIDTTKAVTHDLGVEAATLRTWAWAPAR